MFKKFALSLLVVGVLSACVSSGVNSNSSTRVSISNAIENNIQHALETTESGNYHYWGNNGLDGRIMPTRTFKTSNGLYCREYTSQTRTSAGVNSTNGILCRDNSIDKWVARK